MLHFIDAYIEYTLLFSQIKTWSNRAKPSKLKYIDYILLLTG